MSKKVLVLSIFLALFWPCSLAVYADNEKKPDVPELTAQQYIHLGNVAGRQEKYKQAIGYYTKALEEDPNSTNAYYNRGYVYIELKKYKWAVLDLDKAIELDPEYASAYHLRGVAYFLKKKYLLAIKDYKKAIDLEPENIKFHISRMSAYFKMGNADGAWRDVIKIQQLGGSVNPAIINILKGSQYKDH